MSAEVALPWRKAEMQRTVDPKAGAASEAELLALESPDTVLMAVAVES